MSLKNPHKMFYHNKIVPNSRTISRNRVRIRSVWFKLKIALLNTYVPLETYSQLILILITKKKIQQTNITKQKESL